LRFEGKAKMAASKSIMHFLVDSNESMAQNASSMHGESKLSITKSAIITYCCQRNLDSKTVEFALTSYGDSVTDNAMAASDPNSGYDNINDVIRMETMTQDSYQRIHRMQPSVGTGIKPNTISALLSTFDALVKAKKNYKYNRTMVLVTDGENVIAEDDDDMEDLTNVTKALNKGNAAALVQPIPLYVMLTGKVTHTSSKIKRENSKLLQSLAESTGGGYVEAENMGDILWGLSEGVGMGTTPQKKKINLTIGPNCTVPCIMWQKVMEKKMPALKKNLVKEDESGEQQPPEAVKRVEAAVPGNGPIVPTAPATADILGMTSGASTWEAAAAAGAAASSSPSSSYAPPRVHVDVNASPPKDTPSPLIPMDLEQPGVDYEPPLVSMEPVFRETSHRLAKDANGAAAAGAASTASVDGYKYGQFYVPISDADKEAMKMDSQPGIALIGFMQAHQLPRVHFLGGTTVLQGDDKLAESIKAVAALAQAMRRKNCVAIARKVVKAGDDPVQVALLPPTEDDGTLLVMHIPCSDDYRRYPFKNLPAASAHSSGTEGLAAVGRLVASMTLPGGGGGGGDGGNKNGSMGTYGYGCATQEEEGQLQPLPLPNLTPVNPSYYRVVREIASAHMFLDSKSAMSGVGDVFPSALDLINSSGRGSGGGGFPHQQRKRKIVECVEEVRRHFVLSKQQPDGGVAGATGIKAIYTDRVVGAKMSDEARQQAAASVAAAASKAATAADRTDNGSSASATSGRNAGGNGTSDPQAGNTSSTVPPSAPGGDLSASNSPFSVLETALGSLTNHHHHHHHQEQQQQQQQRQALSPTYYSEEEVETAVRAVFAQVRGALLDRKEGPALALLERLHSTCAQGRKGGEGGDDHDNKATSLFPRLAGCYNGLIQSEIIAPFLPQAQNLSHFFDGIDDKNIHTMT
jgi:hypothetical protein